MVGLVGAMAGLVILLGVGAYFYAYSSAQIPTQLAANVLDQNSTVYYSDGKTPIGTIGPIDRQLLTYSQIPMRVQDAVLAAEDRSFWTEGGISPTGILRAAYDDVTSSGGNLSGGSTITQEFVRQYYSNIGTQQTVSRKIKEIFIAQKLAKSKSKQWILTNYLNTIYLGDNSYGISAAAETYFGVPVDKLTTAQAAVIAAIIQQPSYYPLPQYRANLTARWRLRAERPGADARHHPGAGRHHAVPEDAHRHPVLGGRAGGRDDEHERPVGAVRHERGLQRAHLPRLCRRRRRSHHDAGDRRPEDHHHDQPADGSRDVPRGQREHRRDQGLR